MSESIPIGDGSMFVVVDESDADAVRAYEWRPLVRRRTTYATRSEAGASTRGRTVYLHRWLLGLRSGDDRHVDHRNGNGLDNRRANLRVATRSQNMQNQRVQEKSQSHYKGVRPVTNSRGKLQGNRGGNVWSAAIGPRGQRRHLGVFATAKEAALAYDAAARVLYGEFANVNIPLKDERLAQ